MNISELNNLHIGDIIRRRNAEDFSDVYVVTSNYWGRATVVKSIDIKEMNMDLWEIVAKSEMYPKESE